MLVKKGGIARDIDKMRLHEYTAKGYTPANEAGGTKGEAGSGEKPIEKMNTEELTKKAAELGVDLSGATNNKQRVEAILAHIKANEAGGTKE